MSPSQDAAGSSSNRNKQTKYSVDNTFQVMSNKVRCPGHVSSTRTMWQEIVFVDVRAARSVGLVQCETDGKGKE